MKALVLSCLVGLGLLVVPSLLRAEEPGAERAKRISVVPDFLLLQAQTPTSPTQPAPTTPTTPTTPSPGTTAPTTPSTTPSQTPQTAPTGPTSATDIANLPPSNAPEMLGDLPPLPRVVRIPVNRSLAPAQPFPCLIPTTQDQRDALVPGPRTFKIAVNESPRPQDRVYFSFNYYDNVNKAGLQRLGSPLTNSLFFQDTFGMETTLLGGNASVGLRLPLNSFQADGATGVPGITGTDVGDLSVILKFALWQNPGTRNVITAGFAVTAPTGPDAFAGLDGVGTFHSTALTPFGAYLLNWGSLFVHGFTSIDVPTDSNDVTMLYNDVGLGCFVWDAEDPRAWLTSVVPTVEAHVNTPLNHRGLLGLNDPAGTPDWVDLTAGVNLEFRQRCRMAIGFVTPVTGPRPFDWEALAQLRWRF